MKKLSICVAMAAIVAPTAALAPARAEPPSLQTPAPVIYLSDNLDEPDQLGWCIDTVGRGFGESLHAHSCKPQGGDVQFVLDSQDNLIRSHAFPDHCMVQVPDGDPAFGLVLCEAGDTLQHFNYDVETQAIRPADDASLCVVIGAESRSAGPFVSRALLIAPCADVEPKLREWTVIDG